MRSGLILVPLLFVSLITRLPVHSSFAQSPENGPPPVIESQPPTDDTSPTPAPAEEQTLPEPIPPKPADAVLELIELRNALRLSPDSADNRLKLAQALYNIGDLDAAIEECRMALKLESNNAKAYLQLGITQMAKQDGQAAAIALMEATMLDPGLAQAHYGLGSVQYTLGNFSAAAQSYRRALELQPSFLDARYRLALVLKLMNQHQEAVRLMEDAAIGGISQAQYFMGVAYRNGQGVDKDLSLAIRWWTKAIEFGQQRAAESLSQLRRQALSPDQPERRRTGIIEAFRQYRDGLWADYPDMARKDPNESLGAALLKDNPGAKGVTVLLAEAYALGEAAHDELVGLYETGLDTRLSQFDKRILACFATTAADGFIPAKKALARMYGKGLGITPDLQKAKAMLKGLPKQEMQGILDEIAGR
ncbi:MAG: tetratricopeptide repeat protein [Nitrospira sp.]|nr:MAG: tetratricopeptide repeat protein [Nitrospira sp.]